MEQHLSRAEAVVTKSCKRCHQKVRLSSDASGKVLEVKIAEQYQRERGGARMCCRPRENASRDIAKHQACSPVINNGAIGRGSMRMSRLCEYGVKAHSSRIELTEL